MTGAPILMDVGLISCLGSGKAQHWNRAHSSDRSGLVVTDDFSPGEAYPIGQCHIGKDADASGVVNYRGLSDFMSPNVELMLAAYSQIKHKAEGAISSFGCDRIGVVLGTSTSGISRGEEYIGAMEKGRALDGFNYRQQEMGSPALALAKIMGVSGPAYTLSTACSSSAKALATAARLIDSGCCDAVITGGVDSLCRLTVQGFSALDAMSKTLCDPFGRERSGINIGEAAALFLMVRGDYNKTESCLAPIRFKSAGEASDGYHISAPHPKGEGASASMKMAIKKSGVCGSKLNYINLHGTATTQNDKMESLAVNREFGATMLCGSTKGMTGHTLGAAGALEAALCWLMMSDYNTQHLALPHTWSGQWDESLPSLNLAVHEQRLPSGAINVLSNSFAFGGSNVSIILGRD